MKFRTEIKLKSQEQNQLDHQSKVLLLGSCFSDNIGGKLSYYKFNTLINPFGTLYSPTAIAKVLEDTIKQKKYDENDLVKQGDLYHSLHHHSDLSGVVALDVIQRIHQSQQQCFKHLKSASHIVITLGTSWAYKHKPTNSFVANCHKIPQAEFDKIILSIEEIEKDLKSIVSSIKTVNKEVKVLFTVSPVRHIKDGFVENSLSKAQLLSAIHKIKESHNVAYFGSYEIMMDDLRDYRFYEADMIHPNEVAIDYIWGRFSEVWISEKAQNYFKRIASVQQSKLHRPLQSDSVNHQEFLKKLEIKITQLEKELNVKF